MFVTNWISPTKIQKISEITNFFRHYFLSRTEVKYTLKYFCMDKQIIKNIIIEKQIAIPNYKLVHRDFLFGDKSNYILVGI